MSKLIYKAERPYQEDINDLVEEALFKGGPGSGRRKSTIDNRSKTPKIKMNSQTRKWNADAANAQVKERQAQVAAALKELGKASTDDLVEKGGPGSGIKGHKTSPKKEPVGNAFHQYTVFRHKFENAIKEGKITQAQKMVPELRRLKAAYIAEKKSKS